MSAPQKFLTTAELAERYRTTTATVLYWRTLTPPYGPAGIRVGKRVLYAVEVVEAWDAAQAGGDELAARKTTRTRRASA